MYIQPSGTGLIAEMRKSSVYLALAEDYVTVPTTPFSYVSGGIEARAAYGLGTWSQFLVSLDYDGAEITGITGNDLDGYSEITHINSSVASVKYKGLVYGTNGCATAMDYANYRTTAITSVFVGG